jgi:hypothetical protein
MTFVVARTPEVQRRLRKPAFFDALDSDVKKSRKTLLAARRKKGKIFIFHAIYL